VERSATQHYRKPLLEVEVEVVVDMALRLHLPREAATVVFPVLLVALLALLEALGIVYLDSLMLVGPTLQV
jgi:hypothetical protein